MIFDDELMGNVNRVARIFLRNSDFYSFIKKKYSATILESLGKRKSSLYSIWVDTLLAIYGDLHLGNFQSFGYINRFKDRICKECGSDDPLLDQINLMLEKSDRLRRIYPRYEKLRWKISESSRHTYRIMRFEKIISQNKIENSLIRVASSRDFKREILEIQVFDAIYGHQIFCVYYKEGQEEILYGMPIYDFLDKFILFNNCHRGVE